MDNILNLSIEEMHNALKEGKFKPSDLVKASIERAKVNQETYNAFVTILEEALVRLIFPSLTTKFVYKSPSATTDIVSPSKCSRPKISLIGSPW